MGLEEYHEKRNFETSPEPKGKVSSGDECRFVIQRHQARRLHYDLRLEMEGVLKSWAVPKGPSMNPDDKRLAIHTEDHPIEYLDFSGTIPKGNYGAGKMEIWDQGSYSLTDRKKGEANSLIKAYENGKISIELKGEKLKGRFVLVRSHLGSSEKDHWLLIKAADFFAIHEDYDAEDFLPDSGGGYEETDPLDWDKMVAPMLATVADEPFDDPDWIFELKYDGYRMLANIKDGKVKLYSRNGISYSGKYRMVEEELITLDHSVVLDGEMVVLDQKGISRFERMHNYENDQKVDLRYFVFDLLHLDGHDLYRFPLIDRKELLAALITDMERIHFSDHVDEQGQDFYHNMIEKGEEGIIAKKKDSLYYPGKRSEDWRKIKSRKTIEAVICGYTESDKSGRPFGSLILGQKEATHWKYIGNCGTGFSIAQMQNLFEMFQSSLEDRSPFAEKINLKGRVPQWLNPELVCEVIYSEQTRQGMLRHPVFFRMRPDRKADEMGMEEIDTGSSTKSISSHLEVDGQRVEISNPEKILWPDSGFLKYDLLEYYLQMSEWILPYLRDRPQNLHRHPDGIDRPGFYQKNQEYLPEWIETIEIKSSSGKSINYLMCQDEATLVYMANLGCIEINPWMVRKDHLKYPDYTVIDLDPSPSNTFDEVREAALAVKSVLDKAQIIGYPKISGSAGIHIFIPMGGLYDFSAARDFTRILCFFVQRQLPRLVTMERSIEKRKGRIYLDYLQNRTGQTIVAPYSVRPVSGARVSAPVRWEEIKKGIEVEDFHIKNMTERVERLGDLFYGLLDQKLDMIHAIENLEDVQ